MEVFFFTGLTMTGLILSHLSPSHHWRNWSGSYSDVLPYVRDAFGRATDVLGDHVANARLREELKVMLRQLCDPDPQLRGHPLNRRGVSSPLSVERYVSSFDLLARRAEIGMF
jgi:eukaryotic-like serine/threonine-protein kinase